MDQLVKKGSWKTTEHGVFCSNCNKGWEYCNIPSDFIEYDFCPCCGSFNGYWINNNKED